MDELSELLKEAKPLYLKRKKIKSIRKRCFLALVPIIFCTCAILPFVNTDNQIYYTSSTSVIEQMGLPTDDYGLLQVD